jgi:hypothetical protein
MTQTAAMIENYPADLGGIDREALAETIDACFSCAQACTACADACLSEPDDHLPMLRRCIRTDLDCADICQTTGRVLSRHTGYDANITRALLTACIQACRSCAGECEGHEMAHCVACAAECRRCERACSALLAGLG